MTDNIVLGSAGSADPNNTSTGRTRGRSRYPWLTYILSRLTSAAAIVFTIALLAFFIVRLVPGDPAITILGMNSTPTQLEAVRASLGLDQPWYTQFFNYLGGLLTGDLGTSFRTKLPVSDMIAVRLPVTAMLALGGMLVVMVIGFPLGILAGMAKDRAGSPRNGTAFSAIMSFIGSIPEYIMGTALILVFGLWLRWLPIQGGGDVAGYIMPSLTVGLAASAVMARIVRNETQSVIGQEYMSAARAKRLPHWRLVIFHVLPNVVTSSLTLGGLLIISLLGGAIITENVFNLPGLGTQIVKAIIENDYPEIQGIIVVLGVLAVLITLVIDILLGILDPRVMQSRGAQ